MRHVFVVLSMLFASANALAHGLPSNGTAARKKAAGPRVHIHAGDITQHPADGLVTAINSGGEWNGGVDWAIKGSSAGTQYHDQAMARLPRLEHGKAFVAKQVAKHNGRYRDVVFVTDDVHGPVSEIVVAGLETAAAAGMSSVTHGATRMGKALEFSGKTPRQAADGIMQGVAQFGAKHGSATPLKDIHFVVHNSPETVRELEAARARAGLPTPE